MEAGIAWILLNEYVLYLVQRIITADLVGMSQMNME